MPNIIQHAWLRQLQLIKLFIYSFIHTTGPQNLRKSVLHKVRSSAFFFKYMLFSSSLRSFNSCLHLPPRLLVSSQLYISFNNLFPKPTPTQLHYLPSLYFIQDISLLIYYIQVISLFCGINGKVKVKFTLEQVTRTQRWSGGIAPLFL
jgi:hypothetical protein